MLKRKMNTNGVNKSLQPPAKLERFGIDPGKKTLSFPSFGAGKVQGNVAGNKLDNRSDLCFTDRWTRLKEAVNAVFRSSGITYALEELYQHVEILCYFKMNDQLYTDLRALCENFVKEVLPGFVQEGNETSGYLKTVAAAWELYCTRMIMIRSIFHFMDRQLAVNSSLVPLWDLALTLYREMVLGHPPVRAKVLDSLLQVIRQERSGEAVDRQLLRSIIRMYSDLQLYKSEFEPEFLRQTRQHYHKEALELANRMEVGQYLSHVNRRIQEEEKRLDHYLDVGQTRFNLITCVESELIQNQTDQLIRSGLVPMLDADHRDQLELFYVILARVSGGVDAMRLKFRDYVKDKGRVIVDNPTKDPEKDKQMTQKLLDFKDFLDSILLECFHGDSSFTRAVQEAFEEFLNQRPNKPAEHLAKYLDSRLRSGNKGQTEEELDRLMDKTMMLFRFIEGKDVFEAFYMKELAKRLLMSKSASVDAEKAMLSKLKQECGPNYTRKMETMFADIELSRQLSKTFRTAYQSRFSVELTVNIISPASWPSYNQVAAHYPPEFVQLQQEFTRFYAMQHHGRKLNYNSACGTCVVKAEFQASPECRKELQVSEFQALVLLQFNGPADQPVSYEKIHKATGIEEIELKKVLLSLALGKGQRVLVKRPASTEVEADDVFLVNMEFKHKLTRIKFNQIQLKETKQEQAATEERVFADRVAHVDCAIIRIMKMRKSIEHTNLMNEVYTQLKFPLKASDVKKRIENLIDRDYMKRDANNPALYHYIA